LNDTKQVDSNTAALLATIASSAKNQIPQRTSKALSFQALRIRLRTGGEKTETCVLTESERDCWETTDRAQEVFIHEQNAHSGLQDRFASAISDGPSMRSLRRGRVDERGP
jgi:hypothetical protein